MRNVIAHYHYYCVPDFACDDGNRRSTGKVSTYRGGTAPGTGRQGSLQV
jgi:hypothetical protein